MIGQDSLMATLSPRLLLEIDLNASRPERYWRLRDDIPKHKIAEFRRCSIATGKRPTVFFVLPHIRTGREIEIQFDRPFGSGDRMTTVSDAMVMSFPAEERIQRHGIRGRCRPPALRVHAQVSFVTCTHARSYNKSRDYQTRVPDVHPRQLRPADRGSTNDR
jgi:hypothetical protein